MELSEQEVLVLHGMLERLEAENAALRMENAELRMKKGVQEIAANLLGSVK